MTLTSLSCLSSLVKYVYFLLVHQLDGHGRTLDEPVSLFMNWSARICTQLNNYADGYLGLDPYELGTLPSTSLNYCLTTPCHVASDTYQTATRPVSIRKASHEHQHLIIR